LLWWQDISSDQFVQKHKMPVDFLKSAGISFFYRAITT